MTTCLTLKQVGGSTKGRGETCRQIRQDHGPTCKQLRHRRQRGTKPTGRRAIGILSIPQVLTIGEQFFSELGQVFGCLEKNLQPTDVNLWTVHPQIQHVQSCTAWSHFITRTRVAQELQSSGLHIFVSHETIVIHVSCLVLCRTWHWPPAQVLSHPSHLPFLSFWRSHLCTHALWFSTHYISVPMFHGRVADQRKSHLSHEHQTSRAATSKTDQWTSSTE